MKLFDRFRNRNEASQPMVEGSKPKIGADEVRRAAEILRKYKDGKANLEKRLIANEQFWKQRQWQGIVSADGKAREVAATPWLHTFIEHRLSDVVESYPTCTIRPKQKDDVEQAKLLSEIIPVIMESNRYEETYTETARYALKNGGCVTGVFWDASKYNGIGDISIIKVDFINLFWEPGITNLQESENVFHTTLCSRKLLEEKYPQCRGKISGKSVNLSRYLYDETIDTNDKAVVVDWYYHTFQNGRKVLHYCKFVNDIVLTATENDPKTAETGLYNHGKYPFVTMPLFPIEGGICGYGLTDVGHDTQIQIDLLSQAIVDNAVSAATPRVMLKNGSGINEDEFTDLSKRVVHVEGPLSEDHVRELKTASLGGVCITVLNSKIEELKYCTSNQDANNGIAPSGVTAASALAALQEVAGKDARSTNKAFYRTYREIVYNVIELIRQFYTNPRVFRIVPAEGKEDFINFDNRGLVPQPMIMDGKDMGLRLPEFDIEVNAEKASPYRRIEQNELALQFYQLGFDNPQMADQALACLGMMDIPHKDEIEDRIRRNGTLYEQLISYQQIALELASKHDPVLANQLAQNILRAGGQPIPAANVQITTETNRSNEHPQVERARAQARESTEVE